MKADHRWEDRRAAFGANLSRHALADDVLKLAPMLRRVPKQLDRLGWATARNEWGMNVRLLCAVGAQ